jgi:hypothetical protein
MLLLFSNTRIHPRHGLYPFGRPSAFPLKIRGAYLFLKSFPRDKTFHSIQKYFSPAYPFTLPVF